VLHQRQVHFQVLGTSSHNKPKATSEQEAKNQSTFQVQTDSRPK